jgi:alkylation response protein AidB-like acyl-CoA dehydrogenase
MGTIFEAEHEEFRRSLRGVLQRELVPVLESSREEHRIPRSLWEALGDQGFLGFMVPEEHGGAGLDDFRYNAVLGHELARYGMAFASGIGINTDVVAPYLVDLATPEQRERWLPSFATGRLVTAIGMTEPGAGSDLGALRTTAHRRDATWVLSGSKTFITNGAGADLVVVAARTPDLGPKAITLFGLESGTPGFTQGAALDKVGQPEADTAELFFDEVQLTGDDVVGEPGRGFHHMMERLPRERLGSTVHNLAHAERVFEVTLEYAKERHAFGQPIGSFQHNRFALAELRTALDVAWSFTHDCIRSCVEGTLTNVQSAQAKYVSSEVQGRVLDQCVQLHGGYGYMREYEAARAWMDGRVTRIWAGSNEIMREIIGRGLGL